MKVVEDISGWRFFQYILRWLIPFHLQFQNGVEVIISHSLYEGLFLFVDNIRHLDRMRLLTEQEQIFPIKSACSGLTPQSLAVSSQCDTVSCTFSIICLCSRIPMFSPTFADLPSWNCLVCHWVTVGDGSSICRPVCMSSRGRMQETVSTSLVYSFWT